MGFFSLILLVFCVFLSLGNAKKDKFLPDNDLHLELNLQQSNMSESEFHETLEHVYQIYAPVFQNHGRELIFIGDWYNNTVNAQAYQQGRESYIEIFGGLARRPEITREGLSIIACHEVGHHLGGFPNQDWASLEGQSDYYATQVCAKKIWKYANNRGFYPGDYAASYCDSVFGFESDRNLCYRSMSGSFSSGKLLAAVNYDPIPNFNSPDRSVVRRTLTSYPSVQCRLDTYFQGTLCRVTNENDALPRDESSSNRYLCSRYYDYSLGSRPLCWYRPRIIK